MKLSRRKHAALWSKHPPIHPCNNLFYCSVDFFFLVIKASVLLSFTVQGCIHWLILSSDIFHSLFLAPFMEGSIHHLGANLFSVIAGELSSVGEEISSLILAYLSILNANAIFTQTKVYSESILQTCNIKLSGIYRGPMKSHLLQ